MKIVLTASGKKVLKISKLEWLKIAAQFGIDSNHPSFKSFINDLVGKFQPMLGTLKELYNEINTDPKKVDIKFYTNALDSDIKYVVSITGAMKGDDIKGLKDLIDSFVKNVQDCNAKIPMAAVNPEYKTSILSLISGAMKNLNLAVKQLNELGSKLKDVKDKNYNQDSKIKYRDINDINNSIKNVPLHNNNSFMQPFQNALRSFMF